MLTPSLSYMTEISIVIRQVTLPYMTEISVGFTIVTPGMHFGPEVKWLSMFIVYQGIFFFSLQKRKRRTF